MIEPYFADKLARLQAGEYDRDFIEKTKIAMELADKGITTPPVGTVLVHTLERNRQDARFFMRWNLFRLAVNFRYDKEVVNAVEHYAGRGCEYAIAALGAMGTDDTRAMLQAIANRGDVGAKVALEYFGVSYHGLQVWVEGAYQKEKQAREAQKQGCFIATAVFDSETARPVTLLRRFRNDYLDQDYVGKRFVHAYYKLSEPLVPHIRRSVYLKKIIRRSLELLVDFLPSKLNDDEIRKSKIWSPGKHK